MAEVASEGADEVVSDVDGVLTSSVCGVDGDVSSDGPSVSFVGARVVAFAGVVCVCSVVNSV